VLFLYILCALVLVVLFFPIWVKVALLHTPDDGTEIVVRLWRWTLWTNVAESTPEQAETVGLEQPAQVVALSNANDKMDVSQQPAYVVETPDRHGKPPQHIQQPAQAAELPKRAESHIGAIPENEPKKAQKKSKNTEPESSSDRVLIALALQPRLEKEALKLSKALLVSLWRIFKIRIPTLQVNFGLDNPAHMGWMAAGLWTMQDVASCPPGWEFIPSWGIPGFGGLRTEVRIHVTVARILRFLAVSLVRLLRVSWITWRLYKLYKSDPRQLGLSAWRRFILNKLSPLVTEVQNDQA